MMKALYRVGLVVALGAVTGVAMAASAPAQARHDGTRWQSHQHGQTTWQQRVAQNERNQRQAQRNREWQRQQREIQRRRAEEQRRRNAAWQRKNATWQRQQRAEVRRQARWQREQARREHRRWRRGQRYHGSHVVVNNYGQYHLRRPPHGSHWVRADNKYLLIATATQLILDIASQ